MQLFYDKYINTNDKIFTFDREESKHIVKVLRKKPGDILWLTDGKGNLYQAEIQDDTEKKCVVSIIEVTQRQPPNYYLHLAVAPTKMNDRYEWFLEKATEIGVREITPIICERSERKIVKNERFERVIISAMKQSLQCYKPILNPPTTFEEVLKKSDNYTKCIAHCLEQERKNLKQVLQKRENDNIQILIGPEGDFSQTEIEKALSVGYQPVILSENRLRTETAAIMASATACLCYM